MKTIRAGMLFWLVFIGAARANYAPRSWQYSRPLVPTTIAETGASIGAVVLDPGVLARAKTDLSDIRVVESAARELPYTVVIRAERKETSRFSTRILNNSHVPGAYSVFTADLGSDRLEHNALEIQTSSENFTRWVEIRGSPDEKTWRTLQSKGFIFDHSIAEAGIRSSGKTIVYPLSNYRFLQVVIHDDGREPLSITGATLARETVVPARKVFYDAKIVSTGEDSGEKATVLIVDLGSPNLPHREMTIETPQANFHRHVKIFEGDSPDAQTTWHGLAEGDIYSFITPRCKSERFSLTYPESRRRCLKILIYHYDDPPLPVKRLQVSGEAREVFFPCTAGAPLTLRYGNDQAPAPRYDFAMLHPSVTAEPARLFSLGPESTNPLYRNSPLGLWTSQKKRIALAVTAIAAVVLGLFIFRTMKDQTRRHPPSL